jgi:hypothetical protein
MDPQLPLVFVPMRRCCLDAYSLGGTWLAMRVQLDYILPFITHSIEIHGVCCVMCLDGLYILEVAGLATLRLIHEVLVMAMRYALQYR